MSCSMHPPPVCGLRSLIWPSPCAPSTPGGMIWSKPQYELRGPQYQSRGGPFGRLVTRLLVLGHQIPATMKAIEVVCLLGQASTLIAQAGLGIGHPATGRAS